MAREVCAHVASFERDDAPPPESENWCRFLRHVDKVAAARAALEIAEEIRARLPPGAADPAGDIKRHPAPSVALLDWLREVCGTHDAMVDALRKVWSIPKRLLPLQYSPSPSSAATSSPSGTAATPIVSSSSSAAALAPLDAGGVQKCSDDADACCVCTENRRDCVLVPCGHTQLCRACYNAHVVATPPHLCPTCRTVVTGAMRAFI